MRLIDGDALMNTLCELRDNAIKWLADCREQRSAMTAIRAEQAVLTFNECISQVKKSSEVDAVEVVRCEDCKWGEEKCGNIECHADINVPTEYHGYNWFCPNGERRDR